MKDKHPSGLISDLKAFVTHLGHYGIDMEHLGHYGIDMEPVNRAIWFLENRLTEAAIHGCHHCAETDENMDAPCVWCGLRRTFEP